MVAAELVARTMRGAKLNKRQLVRRGVRRWQLWHVLNSTAKNGCRVDVLCALLDACGYELQIRRKHAQNNTSKAR